jgi:hypothetical protein
MKKLLVGFFLLLIVIAVVCVVILYFMNGNGMTKEKFDQILKVDLPIGTSKENVEAYLKSKKYDYSPDDSGKKIEAMARNINKGMITLIDIHMFFDFDKGDKLTGVTTEKILTGP